MASTAKGIGFSALLLAMLLWALHALPLGAKGRTEQVAQATSIANVPTSADDVLKEMSRAAGVIFAGQVAAIRRQQGFSVAGPGGNASEGVVEVDFRVELALRGPSTGSIYTLREWSGLWDATAGGERYQVGQRLLVFFYDPNRQGLSSPVGGRDGAVPLRGGVGAPGPDDGTTTAGQWDVDLRWLQARALTRHAFGTLPVRRPVSPTPLHDFLQEERDGRGEVEVERALSRRLPLPEPLQLLTSAPAETEPLDQVIMLCQQAMRPADVSR